MNDRNITKNSTATSILIKGSDNSTINIASSFKYETALQAKVDHAKMMKLPTDLYPPNWESRKITQEAITKAARDQANTELIVGRHRTNKQGERTIILMCKYEGSFL